MQDDFLVDAHARHDRGSAGLLVIAITSTVDAHGFVSANGYTVRRANENDVAVALERYRRLLVFDGDFHHDWFIAGDCLWQHLWCEGLLRSDTDVVSRNRGYHNCGALKSVVTFVWMEMGGVEMADTSLACTPRLRQHL